MHRYTENELKRQKEIKLYWVFVRRNIVMFLNRKKISSKKRFFFYLLLTVANINIIFYSMYPVRLCVLIFAIQRFRISMYCNRFFAKWEKITDINIYQELYKYVCIHMIREYGPKTFFYITISSTWFLIEVTSVCLYT